MNACGMAKTKFVELPPANTSLLRFVGPTRSRFNGYVLVSGCEYDLEQPQLLTGIVLFSHPGVRI